MSNTKKRIGLFAIVCVMILSFSITAFASGSNHFPYNSSYKLHTYSSQWKQIAYSDNGFDCWVRITNQNQYASTYSSIRMLGANGQVLWQSTNAIPGLNYADFECGSDVYSIEVKNVYGEGYAYCSYLSER